MQRVASCGGHFSHDYLYHITLGDPPESTGEVSGGLVVRVSQYIRFATKGRIAKQWHDNYNCT